MTTSWCMRCGTYHWFGGCAKPTDPNSPPARGSSAAPHNPDHPQAADEPQPTTSPTPSTPR